MDQNDPPSASEERRSSAPSAWSAGGNAARQLVRVLLAARVRLYREGLQEALKRHGELEVLAACASAEELVRRAASDRPDVVILDTSLCGPRPLVRELLNAVPETKILALAVDDREMNAVLECASAGMAGWVGNDATIEELAQAVQHVARGELMCSARHAALLYGQVANLLTRGAEAPAATPLTAREQDVGALLARGMSNKGISRALGIGLATVKNHVHNILGKLEVSSRSEAGARLSRLLPDRGASESAPRISAPSGK